MSHVVAPYRLAIVIAALAPLMLTLTLGCGRVFGPTDDSGPTVVVAFRAGAYVDESRQWPGWRGGAKAGVSTDQNVAISWSKRHGVRWKTSLRGSGHSSPVVWNDAVFLTTAIETSGGSQLELLCFDSANGTIRWQADLGMTKSETAGKNGYASATVATDGDAVFSYGGGIGLFCHDFDGHERWRVSANEIDHIWGTASSPVLHGNLVIQLCDGRSGSFIAAYDKHTGQEVWRKDRQSRGCWSTPVLVEAPHGDRSRWELIVNGGGVESPRGGWVIAYDPAGGDELWRLRGTTDVVCPTAIVGSRYVFCTSGRNGPIIAIRPGGDGDITRNEQRQPWRVRRGGAYVPTGVAFANRLFTVSDSGLLMCRKQATGEEVWRRWLGHSFTASLIVAGGRL